MHVYTCNYSALQPLTWMNFLRRSGTAWDVRLKAICQWCALEQLFAHALPGWSSDDATDWMHLDIGYQAKHTVCFGGSCQMRLLGLWISWQIGSVKACQESRGMISPRPLHQKQGSCIVQELVPGRTAMASNDGAYHLVHEVWWTWHACSKPEIACVVIQRP